VAGTAASVAAGEPTGDAVAVPAGAVASVTGAVAAGAVSVPSLDDDPHPVRMARQSTIASSGDRARRIAGVVAGMVWRWSRFRSIEMCVGSVWRHGSAQCVAGNRDSGNTSADGA
jgi:hypothetical protein